MSKTTLQLLNEVGKNLRRSTGSTYTTITQDPNAVFIVQAINEAKRMVEDELLDWDWPGLRVQVTFSSVASTNTYDLSSVGTPVTLDRARVVYDQSGRLQFWDVTDTGANFRMIERTQDYALNDNLLAGQDVEKPQEVAVYPNGSGLTVFFPSAPTGIRNYRIEVMNPQDDLTSANTVLTVPYRLVVLAATALSCEERGEEFGMNATRWWEQYQKAMAFTLGRDTNAADLVLIPV
jgi:hypothetical protein